MSLFVQTMLVVILLAIALLLFVSLEKPDVSQTYMGDAVNIQLLKVVSPSLHP